MAPLRDGDPGAWQAHLAGLAGSVDVDWTWGSLGAYLDAVEANGVAPNVATCVGLGTVRYDVLGMADRDPTGEELAAMGERVTAALEDGAVALSAGLVYPPQTYAGTDEVRAMAERLAPFGRPFVAHIRSERRRLWEALDEFVEIGAAAGVPLHLSHFKVPGPLQRGKADRATARLAAARERGVDVTADQYPYTAGSTMLSNVLPPWAQADGPEATLERLADTDARERIRRDVTEWRIDDWQNLGRYTGWENVVITSVGGEADDDAGGDRVAALARERGTDPVTVVCDLLLEAELNVSMLLHHVDEDDVRDILTDETVCVGTDGLFGGRPHPRVYGTYPKILGRYVRTEDLLSLEEAVRKMTSLPARAMGLETKGLVRPGMDADLVVFDPLTVDSPATYDDPRQFPTGIDHVVVNGDPVVSDGELTGRTPGRAVRA
jgi:N-acyl-D-amino-acid deacylase